MANSQWYSDVYCCSRWPICTFCCCVAAYGLSTWLTIPRKAAICLRLPLSCRKTGVPITLFATRCSLSLHYEGDSREHSPVFKFSSVLSFLLEFWHSFVHFHGSLHAYNMFKDICHHLHAVISYEASYGPLGSIDPRIDLTRLCSDQGQWFHSNRVIMVHRISITNPSTISSAIPLALVSSVSTLLPLIPRSYDSRSPSLCTKLCYWPFKHVFHTW